MHIYIYAHIYICIYIYISIHIYIYIWYPPHKPTLSPKYTPIPGGEVAPQTPPQLTGFWIDGVAVLQTPPELRPVEQIVLPADAIEMKAYERDLPSLCDWEKRLSCNCAVLQLNRFASFC